MVPRLYVVHYSASRLLFSLQRFISPISLQRAPAIRERRLNFSFPPFCSASGVLSFPVLFFCVCVKKSAWNFHRSICFRLQLLFPRSSLILLSVCISALPVRLIAPSLAWSVSFCALPMWRNFSLELLNYAQKQLINKTFGLNNRFGMNN